MNQGSFVELLESRRLLAATLSGVVWNDLNGNGRRDAGEPGLANQRIYIDLNFNGEFDRNEPSVLTNSTGNYQFTNRPNGIQRLRYDVPAGRRLTAPGAIFYDATVVGSNISGRNFASTDTGVIVGTVYEDLNSNSRRDASERGLRGWTVFLDKNRNGKFDPGEKSRITDVNGNYRFAGLPAGTYVVRIVQQSGWTRTQPTSGAYTVAVAAGQSYSNRHFGERDIA